MLKLWSRIYRTLFWIPIPLSILLYFNWSKNSYVWLLFVTEYFYTVEDYLSSCSTSAGWDPEYFHSDSGTTCPKLSLLHSEAHLVLDSWLEVPQKGVGFVVLHLPVLHRPTAQEVIQLCGKDGRRSTLILGTLISCRKEILVVKLSFSPLLFILGLHHVDAREVILH